MLYHGAAIAPRPASSTEFVSNDFPILYTRHFGSDLTGITAHAVQTRVKRPLLELVRREAILQCDADRLVQFLMRQKNERFTQPAASSADQFAFPA